MIPEKDIDGFLSDVCMEIIISYNGSYKPHLFPEKDMEKYRIRHQSGKYILTSRENDKTVEEDNFLGTFIEKALKRTGQIGVKWEDIKTSSAVEFALKKYYGVKIEEIEYIGG